MRLIDADELIKLREDVIAGRLNVGSEGDLVDLCPTIDAVPVKRGRWFDTGVENETGNIYFCSVCNKFHNPNKKDVTMKRAKEKPEYCPNCGAHMKDGE